VAIHLSLASVHFVAGFHSSSQSGSPSPHCLGLHVAQDISVRYAPEFDALSGKSNRHTVTHNMTEQRNTHSSHGKANRICGDRSASAILCRPLCSAAQRPAVLHIIHRQGFECAQAKLPECCTPESCYESPRACATLHRTHHLKLLMQPDKHARAEATHIQHVQMQHSHCSR